MYILINPLILAIKNNDTDTISEILDKISTEENCIEIMNQADTNGMTPLHYACEVFNKTKKNIFVINRLVRLGADFSVSNNQGKMPAQLITLYTNKEQQEFADEIKNPPLSTEEEEKEEDGLIVDASSSSTTDVKEDAADIERADTHYMQMSASRKKLHLESKAAEALSKKIGNSKLGTAGALIILWGIYAALMGVTADQYANPSHRIYSAPATGFPPPPPVNEEQETAGFKSNLLTFGIIIGMAKIALTFIAIYFARSTYTTEELRTFHDDADKVDTTKIDEKSIADKNQRAVLELRERAEALQELHASILQESSPATPLDKLIKANKKVQQTLNVANHPMSFYARLNEDPSVEPEIDKKAIVKIK